MHVALVVAGFLALADRGDVARPVAAPLPVQTPAKAFDGRGAKESDADRTAREKLRSIEAERRGPDARRDAILQRPSKLEVLDQGLADVGPLGSSLRDLPADATSAPVGFQRVYRDPSDPERLMRGNGALRAIFPFSQYRQTRRGQVVLLPSATTFRIGDRIDLTPPKRWDPFADSARERVDARVSTTPIDGRSTERGDIVLGRIDGREASGGEAGSVPGRAIAARSADFSVREPVRGATLAMPPIVADLEYRRAFLDSIVSKRALVEPSPAPASEPNAAR
jgi:hypothetical protein